MPLPLTSLLSEIDTQLPSTGKGTIDAKTLRGVLKDIATSAGGQTRLLLPDYGISDGTTDNSAGFNRLNVDGRAVIAAGQRIILDATPNHSAGIWAWNGSTGPEGFNFWLSGLTNLTIDGNNASFKNLDPGGGQTAWPVSPLNYFNNGTNVYTINTVTAYATTVTLNPITTAPDFQPGDWVMIGSLAIQDIGSPPNLDRNDFARVVSWDKVTGIVTLDRFIINEHRADFPDSGVTDGAHPWGKARIYQLKFPGQDLIGGLFLAGAQYAYPWAYDHHYKDMSILPSTGGNYSMVIHGVRFRAENCTLPGVVPSFLMEWSTENCYYAGVNEPDKSVGVFQSKNDRFLNQIPFQSQSVDDVTFINPYCPNGIAPGGKRFTVIGGNAPILGVGRYGQNRSFTCINLHNNAESEDFGADGVITIDGATFTYSNGTIRQVKGPHDAFRVVPGQQIIMTGGSGGPDFIFPGDLGVLTVLALREDATYWYIDTDGPAALPAWSSSQFLLMNSMDRRYINCTGGSVALRGSEATRRGLKHNEFYGWRFVNPSFNNGGSNGDWPLKGRIKAFEVNVGKITAITTPTLTFTFSNMRSSADPGSGLGDLTLRIDLSVTGGRTVDWRGSIGMSGSDRVQLNGVTITTLPNNALISRQMVWNFSYDPTLHQPYELPIVEVRAITSVGMLHSFAPTLTEPAGSKPIQITGGTP